MKASKELLLLKRQISKEALKGIYFLLQDDDVVYIGKTITGVTRIYQHVGKKKFNHYCFINMPDLTEKELYSVEAKYILKYEPTLNKMFGKGDNNYISINKFCIKHGYDYSHVRYEAEKLKHKKIGRFKMYLVSDLISMSSTFRKNK